MTIHIDFKNNRWDFYKNVTNINFNDNKLFIYVDTMYDTIIIDMQKIKYFKIKQ